MRAPLRFLLASLFMLGLFLTRAGAAWAMDAEVDFAYTGGAYLIMSTSEQNAVLKKLFGEALRDSGIPRKEVVVKSYMNEDVLLEAMKEKKVAFAAVTHQFYIENAEDLELLPLGVPLIDGQPYQRYMIFKRADNDSLNSVEDLADKSLAYQTHGNDWYMRVHFGKAFPVGKVTCTVMPDLQSIPLAVWMRKVDAGVLSDDYWRNFLALRPNYRGKIEIFVEGHWVLCPPLVYQRGRFMEEEAAALRKTLIESNPRLMAMTRMIGLSGFAAVTDKQIRKIYK